jgi:Mg-chelatase subunit ChlD
MMDPPEDAGLTGRDIAVRWRLALGRHARGALQGAGLSDEEQRLDATLEVVYGRGRTARGYREPGPGSLDPSQITAPRWLDEARRLFPKSVFEVIQAHAVERFGMTEFLSDPEALKRLEPNLTLLKVLMSFKGRADPSVAEPIRQIVRTIVDDLRRRLAKDVARAFSGSRNRFQSTSQKRLANFDIRGTVRANLKTWSLERRAIVAERLRFTTRQRRHWPWTVILCVDQSGSMVGALIHAVVLASILAALPAVTVKLVVFDTSVVDLSGQLDDPTDLLLSVQLGGGTDIGKAVTYCEGLVTQPSRTVLALISDFQEGGSPAALVRAVRRLAEARVTLLGLAALGEEGEPVFDRDMAGRLAEVGMSVAALTPDAFADWLCGVIR